MRLGLGAGPVPHASTGTGLGTLRNELGPTLSSTILLRWAIAMVVPVRWVNQETSECIGWGSRQRSLGSVVISSFCEALLADRILRDSL